MTEFNVGDMIKYHDYSVRKGVYGIVTEKISRNVVDANITHPISRTVTLYTDRGNLELIARNKNHEDR